jgi:uncharacterized protein YjbI with pentapeptide repeats
MKKLSSPKNTWILVSIASLIFFISTAAKVKNGQLKWADWTGFGKDVEMSRTVERNPNQNNEITKRTVTRRFQSGKTLWDWIGVAGSIAVPILLVYLANRLQASQQRQAEEAAKEEVLQTYFDRLSELLIDKNLIAIASKNQSPIIQAKELNTVIDLLKDKATNEEKELIAAAKDVVRARTLSVLQRLEKDSARKSRIIQFLIDTEITNKLQLNLSGAILSGAILNRAELSGAILSDTELTEAELSDAHLTKAELGGANLSGANLIRAELSGANLYRANLSEATLIKAELTKAELSGANLIRAILQQVNLSEAYLVEAKLSGADLRLANLSKAYLNSADFSSANLYHANLSSADLSFANLSKANLSKANLSKANFNNTILLRANLDDSKGLQQEQLTRSESPLLCATKLPTGMEDLSDRDCDRLPQVLLTRYPKRFKTLKEVKQYVKESRKQ